MRCVVCSKREPEVPAVCGPDRWLMDLRLREVPVLAADLETQYRPERDDWARDPVALLLPSGPVAGASREPRVGGSRERGVPARFDLLAPAYRQRDGVTDDQMVPMVRSSPDTDWVTALFDGRYVRQEVRRRERVIGSDGNPVMVPAGDQVGTASVAAILDSWCRDWITYDWCSGDHLPVPTISELAGWLAVRLEDACDHHPAIAEFADELRDVHLALRSANGLTEPRPQLCDGVPCRRVECDQKALYRIPGSPYVECGSCGLLYTESEYQEWVKLVASSTRRKGEAA